MELKTPGYLNVKGIGWFIEEYGVAQISYNLTNINVSPLHKVFDKTCERAIKRNASYRFRISRLVPKKVLIDAEYLKKQQRSTGIHENEIIKLQ